MSNISPSSNLKRIIEINSQLLKSKLPPHIDLLVLEAQELALDTQENLTINQAPVNTN